jgi:hypothetical protein
VCPPIASGVRALGVWPVLRDPCVEGEEGLGDFEGGGLAKRRDSMSEGRVDTGTIQLAELGLESKATPMTRARGSGSGRGLIGGDGARGSSRGGPGQGIAA